MSWYIPNMGYQENYLPYEQKEQGHDIEIITSDRYPPFKLFENNYNNIFGERIVGSGCFIDKDIKINRLKCFFEYKEHQILVLKGLYKKLKEIKPDVVQSHGMLEPYSVQLILFQKIIGYKLFFDEHTDYKNLYPFNNIKKIYLKLLGYFFYPFFNKRISKIFPITPGSEKVLIKELRIPKDKIQLIPLGVDNKKFYQNRQHRDMIREKLHIKKDDVVAIYAGKINPEKKIELLIETSNKLIKKYNNYKLLIVGNLSGNYPNLLKKIVKNYNTNNNIIFHDFVSNHELPYYYSAGDIGIWPSDPSNTIIEAMSCSLPIILPKNIETNHLIENNGFIYNINIKDDLFLKIEELIVNNNIRWKMGKNSKLLVEKKFSSSLIAKLTLEAYRTNS